MKFLPKEILVAIVLGFIVGLIITYGIWNANRALKQKQQVVSPIPAEAATPSANTNSTADHPDNSFKLSITQPEQHTLTAGKTITVSGFTQPSANIVIYSETDPLVLIAQADGKFTADVALETGINYITITVISDNGQQTTQTRTVVYSTTELEP